VVEENVPEEHTKGEPEGGK
jgi:small subunit ribosomal protein S3